MADGKLLTELMRAIAREDLTTAREVCERIGDHEEKLGHHRAARNLRGILKGTTGSRAPVAQTMNIISTALVRLEPPAEWDKVVLSESLKRSLQQIVLEWKNLDRLKARGLHPRSKLLFHGPPGCGKSLTARAIGAALGLPTYLVRFDAIIGAYLGQTAIHLRQLFAFAEQTPCILLLDELDALGKRRGNPLDVGELDRIVIALLQELEHSSPRGLVVATTNLAANLDEALWRRFDLSLEFPAPGRSALRKFATEIGSRYKTTVPKPILDTASKATSFASSEKVILDYVRECILLDSH